MSFELFVSIPPQPPNMKDLYFSMAEPGRDELDDTSSRANKQSVMNETDDQSIWSEMDETDLE